MDSIRLALQTVQTIIVLGAFLGTPAHTRVSFADQVDGRGPESATTDLRLWSRPWFRPSL